ncbi:Enoyl-CoA delta isomerase 2, mitochondrial [Allomyces arbusculus]|nr:Enoyl-CoA delta isomerase 2, mitochondrial [Allomyces arbusculus]
MSDPSTVFARRAPEGYQYQTIKVTSLEGGRVRLIAFSRPERYNALSPLAYKEWLLALNDAAVDDDVLVTVVVGTGPYYSSGNELSPPTPDQANGILAVRAICEANPSIKLLEDPLPDLAPEHRDLVERGIITRELVSTMIHFPKLLIAGVNGPAIGFAATTLAHFDFVFATKEAWFMVPFMQWGFCAEGASSVLFPEILGPAIANQMLYMGKKFTAEELLPTGLVTEILSIDTFQKEVIARACKLAKSLPPQAFTKTKRLVRHRANELDRANYNEMNLLIERMASEECEKRVMQFFMKKMGKPKPKM